MFTILTVDDESHILRALYRVLRSSDVEIVGTRDPFEALELAGQKRFDMVLTDERMPGMRGTELLARFAQVQPGWARLSMSAYQDFAAMMQAFNAGLIQHFVPKPWDNDALREAVRKHLPGLRSANGSETDLLTVSPAMAGVLERIDALSDSWASVSFRVRPAQVRNSSHAHCIAQDCGVPAPSWR